MFPNVLKLKFLNTEENLEITVNFSWTLGQVLHRSSQKGVLCSPTIRAPSWSLFLCLGQAVVASVSPSLSNTSTELLLLLLLLV